MSKTISSINNGKKQDNLLKIAAQRMKDSKQQPKSVDKEDSLFEVGVDLLIENPNQPRIQYKDIEKLSKSIKKHGILQPIIISPKKDEDGKYFIIAGHRRAKAAKMAGVFKIPAIIKNIDLATQKELSIIENIQRKNLSPSEIALAIKSFVEIYPEITQSEIAKKLGISKSSINNYFKIRTLSKDFLLEAKNKGISKEKLMILGGLKNKSTEEIKKIETIILSNPNMTIKELREIIKPPKKNTTYIVSKKTSTTIYFGKYIPKSKAEQLNKEILDLVKKYTEEEN